MSESKEPFAGWCVLELLGHRRLAGYVQEQEIAGAGFLRIDIPGDKPGQVYATQFYAPGSVYGITPVTEATARAVARSNRPQPVHRWEMPSPALPRPERLDLDKDEYEDDEPEAAVGPAD